MTVAITNKEFAVNQQISQHKNHRTWAYIGIPILGAVGMAIIISMAAFGTGTSIFPMAALGTVVMAIFGLMIVASPMGTVKKIAFLAAFVILAWAAVHAWNEILDLT